MKKLMLLVLGSTLLAIAAIAHEPQTKQVSNSEQAALSNATLYGINSLNNDVYIQAYNTSTSQTYYLTVPSNGSSSTSLPHGNYNISVSSGSTLSNMYISNQSSYSAYSKYWWSFDNISVTTSYATVVSVGAA